MVLNEYVGDDSDHRRLVQYVYSCVFTLLVTAASELCSYLLECFNGYFGLSAAAVTANCYDQLDICMHVVIMELSN